MSSVELLVVITPAYWETMRCNPPQIWVYLREAVVKVPGKRSIAWGDRIAIPNPLWEENRLKQNLFL